MAKRIYHYESAFEDHLRHLELPYIAIDESRRPLIHGTSVKNMDFIVHVPAKKWTLLIDVKGKQFPYRNKGGIVYWENWIGEEDLTSLFFWSRSLGSTTVPLILFNYWIHRYPDEIYFSSLHSYKDRTYGMVAVLVDDYLRYARIRSPRWKALYVPKVNFLEIVRPFSYFVNFSSKAWKKKRDVPPPPSGSKDGREEI